MTRLCPAGAAAAGWERLHFGKRSDSILPGGQVPGARALVPEVNPGCIAVYSALSVLYFGWMAGKRTVFLLTGQAKYQGQVSEGSTAGNWAFAPVLRFVFWDWL